MIADCPGCGARYRIEPGRLRPEGVRLRCTRCEAIFRVRPPIGPPQGEAVSGPPGSAPAPVQAPPTPEAAAGPEQPRASAPGVVRESTPPPTDRDRLVLVADPEVEQGKATAGALVHWGLQPVLVHDGVEAIMTIQRLLPRAIVLDAALPKMFGFQVCELVKRNESLRHIQVALVGAIHDRQRYRRPPTELYGADAYLERHQLPAALEAILQGFGLPIESERGSLARREPVSPPAATEPAPADSPSPIHRVAPRPSAPAEATGRAPEPVASHPAPQTETVVEAPPPAPREAVSSPAIQKPVDAPAPDSEPGALHARPSEVGTEAPPDDEIARAERLARIVVSDIVLYNREKFEVALREGNVLEAMDAELAEGRSLIASRIDAALRQERDFLAEELLRVADERAGS